MAPTEVAPWGSAVMAAPSSTAPSLVPQRGRRSNQVELVGGVAYVILAIACAISYASMLAPFLKNDFFWTNFNTTGAQAFVADYFNSRMWNTSSPTDLDLFDRLAIEKSYAAPTTAVDIQATDMRRNGMEQLRDIDAAIVALRAQPTRTSVVSYTCYCWLDFSKTWQVAHTEKRQQRCLARYAHNGVVYLEAMLRNTQWNLWYKQFGMGFDMAYGASVRSTPRGVQWLEATTTARGTYSPAQEQAFWASHGIREYTVSWANGQDHGLSDVVLIRNAWQTFSIPIKQLVQKSRGSLWTSAIASFGVWNDFYYALDMHTSLVRSDNNSFVHLGDDMSPEIWIGAYPYTMPSVLLHDFLGPLGAIDLHYVAVPAPLLTAYAAAATRMRQMLHASAAFREAYSALPSTPTAIALPPPTPWQQHTWTFYGGNLLCYDGQGHDYVQDGFGFDDGCTAPFSPATIRPTRRSALLAMYLQRLSSPWTRLDHPFFQTVEPALRQFLEGSAPLHVLLPYESSTTIEDGAPLIEFVQYALSANQTPVMLRHTLLSPSDPLWATAGWVMVVDWIQGSREVVRFEGDESTVVLVSRQLASIPFRPDPLGVPSRFTSLVWMLFVYFNGIVCLVLAFLVQTVMMFRIVPSGRNLLAFNAIAGVVWVGRPLLLLRGTVAMVVLSTSAVAMTANPWTEFLVEPRSLWSTMVTAGETLWLTLALCDILMLFTTHHTKQIISLAFALVWISTVALETAAPIVPTAIMDRHCSSSNMDMQLDCVSGIVEIGSNARLVALGALQIGCIALSWIIVAVWTWLGKATPPPAAATTSAAVMVPSIAYYLIDNVSVSDRTAYVISGLVPFVYSSKEHLFNVLLWLIMPAQDQNARTPPPLPPRALHDKHPTLRLGVSALAMTSVTPVLHHPHQSRRCIIRYRVVLGMVFLVCSAASSVLFFVVSQVKLANDFLWTDFNTTGMHSFLAKMYNTELIYRRGDALPPDGSALPAVLLALDDPSTGDSNMYNTSIAEVRASALAARDVQFDGTSLLDNVRGLRRTDGCDAAWISTQYCYVDFGQVWELANSARRQQRCKAMATNGAVFLETLLRNTNVRECWGDALEVGVDRELRMSLAGMQWLDATNTATTTPNEEVAFWRRHNISSYVVAWQNYKSLGIAESILVETTFAATYALTIKSSNGTYRFAYQSTFKMHWGFANDLAFVASNLTADGDAPMLKRMTATVFGSALAKPGHSLVRGSATYAFANASAMESILFASNVLASPMNAGLALVRNAVGPFGSIDVRHVPCPRSMLVLRQAVAVAIKTAIAKTLDAQKSVLPTRSTFRPAPRQWNQDNPNLLGGSPFCPSQVTGQALVTGLLSFFSHAASCSTTFSELIDLNMETGTLALVTTTWNRPNASAFIDETCGAVTANTSIPRCLSTLRPLLQWMNTYLSSTDQQQLAELVPAAERDVIAAHVQVMQFVQAPGANADIELWRHDLIDPVGDPHFTLFGWSLAAEWAQGDREVVSLRGDSGAPFTVISCRAFPDTFQPSELETPTNVAYYCHMCIQYTTSVGFVTAAVTLLYTVASRGDVEGGNLLAISRVAGIVWVGRLLLFFRSIVAIALLSTSMLKLELNGAFTTITSPQPTGFYVLLTFLAGLEISWLETILSDIGMIFTRDHTASYKAYSSAITSTLAVLLTILAPVQPSLEVSRSCDVTQMDFQVVCHAGKVAIGSGARFALLCAITAGTLVVCFAYQRVRHPVVALPRHHQSLWLPASAFYLYRKTPWVFADILFLDKASAFMCGLVSVRYGDAIYLVDVKTWRMFTINIDQEFRSSHLSLDERDQARIDKAIPLLE